MAKSFGGPKFTMRLVVDAEKSKVVLAEACRDFVDVLFSLLTLPMGTIVRLLERHKKSSEPVTLGCFSNLYRSVVNMGTDNFQTEACKWMVEYPRSVRDVQCKRLKLNLHPTEGLKCHYCNRSYSDSSTSRCRCQALKNDEIQFAEEVSANPNDVNGVFVHCRSSYILTDDLEVEFKSTELVLKKLTSLGYADVSKLGERVLHIGLEEVLSLLECMFSSNAPLTDTFLNKQGVTKIHEKLSPYMEEKEDDKVLTLKAFVRNEDMKILFVECAQDFVELLFSFLSLPLESVGKIFGDNIILGSIRNLRRSFKNFTADKETEESTTKCVLHYFYDFQMQIPGSIKTQQPLVYYSYDLDAPRQVNHGPYCSSTTPLVVMKDPKSLGSNQSSTCCYGFLKKETKFTVLDDLSITPMNSCSTVSILKKLQSRADNLDVQVISISKAEALNLLRASVVTSSALNTALYNLIAREEPAKEDHYIWNPTSKKPKEET